MLEIHKVMIESGKISASVNVDQEKLLQRVRGVMTSSAFMGCTAWHIEDFTKSFKQCIEETLLKLQCQGAHRRIIRESMAAWHKEGGKLAIGWGKANNILTEIIESLVEHYKTENATPA